MTIYVKSKRSGNVSYSAHTGMSLETVLRLLDEIGATEVEQISEDTYNKDAAQK